MGRRGILLDHGEVLMNTLPLDEIVFTAEPHSYHWRGKRYESVTGYIKDVLGDDFANVPQDKLAFCQGRGNAVHLAAALFVAGELDWSTVDPRIEGYVRAVERFHAECKGPIVAWEQRLVCPAMGLAGTPDLIKFIRNKRAVIDYKTSQQGKPRMRLQTVGYAKLWNATFPKTPVYDRYGLRLQSDGFYKLIPHDDPDDEAAFQDILAEGQARERAARWKEKYA
jgi:hypothetical protein